jgi:hypothetical protein
MLVSGVVLVLVELAFRMESTSDDLLELDVDKLEEPFLLGDGDESGEEWAILACGRRLQEGRATVLYPVIKVNCKPGKQLVLLRWVQL